MCEYCILLPFRNYKMFGNTYKLCFLLFSTAFSVWEWGTGRDHKDPQLKALGGFGDGGLRLIFNFLQQRQRLRTQACIGGKSTLRPRLPLASGPPHCR